MNNDTRKSPLTVLMPVFNAEKHVGGAIRSILDQTFDDFQFLIIDDGSTDGTRNVIRSFDDRRIEFIEGHTNRGLPKRLNEGIAQSESPLIARMDGDDVSLPNRLETQIGYLDAHPDIALVGGQISFSTGSGSHRRFEVPILPKHIRWALHFGNCIGHMTVMARRELFIEMGGYDENLATAQDYDLWARANDRFLMTNVRQCLVEVTERSESISRSMASTRETNARRVMHRAVEAAIGRDVPPSVEEILWSPTSIRRDPALSQHVAETVSIIEDITARSISDPDATPAEIAAINRDATYRVSRLALLAMTVDFSTGRRVMKGSHLISTSSLIGAWLKAMKNRAKSVR